MINGAVVCYNPESDDMSTHATINNVEANVFQIGYLRTSFIEKHTLLNLRSHGPIWLVMPTLTTFIFGMINVLGSSARRQYVQYFINQLFKLHRKLPNCSKR